MDVSIKKKNLKNVTESYCSDLFKSIKKKHPSANVLEILILNFTNPEKPSVLLLKEYLLCKTTGFPDFSFLTLALDMAAATTMFLAYLVIATGALPVAAVNFSLCLIPPSTSSPTCIAKVLSDLLQAYYNLLDQLYETLDASCKSFKSLTYIIFHNDEILDLLVEATEMMCNNKTLRDMTLDKLFGKKTDMEKNKANGVYRINLIRDVIESGFTNVDNIKLDKEKLFNDVKDGVNINVPNITTLCKDVTAKNNKGKLIFNKLLFRYEQLYFINKCSKGYTEEQKNEFRTNIDDNDSRIIYDTEFGNQIRTSINDIYVIGRNLWWPKWSVPETDKGLNVGRVLQLNNEMGYNMRLYQYSDELIKNINDKFDLTITKPPLKDKLDKFILAHNNYAANLTNPDIFEKYIEATIELSDFFKSSNFQKYNCPNKTPTGALLEFKPDELVFKSRVPPWRNYTCEELNTKLESIRVDVDAVLSHIIFYGDTIQKEINKQIKARIETANVFDLIIDGVKGKLRVYPCERRTHYITTDAENICLEMKKFENPKTIITEDEYETDFGKYRQPKGNILGIEILETEFENLNNYLSICGMNKKGEALNNFILKFSNNVVNNPSINVHDELEIFYSDFFDKDMIDEINSCMNNKIEFNVFTESESSKVYVDANDFIKGFDNLVKKFNDNSYRKQELEYIKSTENPVVQAFYYLRELKMLDNNSSNAAMLPVYKLFNYIRSDKLHNPDTGTFINDKLNTEQGELMTKHIKENDVLRDYLEQFLYNKIIAVKPILFSNNFIINAKEATPEVTDIQGSIQGLFPTQPWHEMTMKNQCKLLSMDGPGFTCPDEKDLLELLEYGIDYSLDKDGKLVVIYNQPKDMIAGKLMGSRGKGGIQGLGNDWSRLKPDDDIKVKNLNKLGIKDNSHNPIFVSPKKEQGLPSILCGYKPGTNTIVDTFVNKYYTTHKNNCYTLKIQDEYLKQVVFAKYEPGELVDKLQEPEINKDYKKWMAANKKDKDKDDNEEFERKQANSFCTFLVSYFEKTQNNNYSKELSDFCISNDRKRDDFLHGGRSPMERLFMKLGHQSSPFIVSFNEQMQFSLDPLKKVAAEWAGPVIGDWLGAPESGTEQLRVLYLYWFTSQQQATTDYFKEIEFKKKSVFGKSIAEIHSGSPTPPDLSLFPISISGEDNPYCFVIDNTGNITFSLCQTLTPNQQNEEI